MRLPPRFTTILQRWAASWWSLGAQAGMMMFCIAALIALLLNRQHYERGVIPTPLFQGSDAQLFAVMDPDSAMLEWYFLAVYLGLCVLAGPVLLVASWRLRRRLQNRPQDVSVSVL